MIYSDNLTNLELLKNAMPLKSISRSQWKSLLQHLEIVEGIEGEDSDLVIALKTVLENQSKMEIISNYNFYYHEELNKPVPEESITLAL